MKFSKYGTAPVEHICLFASKEKEKEFLEAPEPVRRMAMNLLEACVKQKMDEVCQDFILKRIQDLEERVKELEGQV